MDKGFKEVQRYRQWWMWLIMSVVAILPIYSIVQQIILGIPFGNHPAPDGVLIVFAIFIFGLVFTLFRIRLTTEVNWDGICIHYSPFFKKQVQWHRVAKAEIVDYGFVGGWGIRYSSKYGWVYNISGRKGLAVELMDGSRFVIGSQQTESLKKAVIEFNGE